MTEGIYILANDVVYDQLVALLNSIEVNAGKEYPICVIPYDDRMDKVCELVQSRQGVTLFEDASALSRWEDFATQIWQAHPTAFSFWQSRGTTGVYRMGMQRRFCVLDGPFEKGLYLDADILIMGSLEPLFRQLDQSDWVVYDFQFKDPSHVYDVDSPKLFEVFDQSRLDAELFCAGLYACNRGVFDQARLDWLLEKLRAGEAEILYTRGPDQAILNYMVMRSGISSYNFAHHLPEDQVTGCCVTSPHFEVKDNLAFDHGKRLIYLHYIGLSSQLFRRLCDGENIDFPYRDLFLHYRYLHEPEKRPRFTTKPKPYNQPPGLATRVLKKLKLVR